MRRAPPRTTSGAARRSPAHVEARVDRRQLRRRAGRRLARSRARRGPRRRRRRPAGGPARAPTAASLCRGLDTVRCRRTSAHRGCAGFSTPGMTVRPRTLALPGRTALACAPGRGRPRADLDGTIVQRRGHRPAGYRRRRRARPPTCAELDTPRDVAFLADGSYLIADIGNDRIRRVASQRDHRHRGLRSRRAARDHRLPRRRLPDRRHRQRPDRPRPARRHADAAAPRPAVAAQRHARPARRRLPDRRHRQRPDPQGRRRRSGHHGGRRRSTTARRHRRLLRRDRHRRHRQRPPAARRARRPAPRRRRHRRARPDRRRRPRPPAPRSPRPRA